MWKLIVRIVKFLTIAKSGDGHGECCENGDGGIGIYDEPSIVGSSDHHLLHPLPLLPSHRLLQEHIVSTKHSLEPRPLR